ncbi:MAG: DNA-binding response regulator [Flavobacteriaceae bacterium]|nr:MAG: DNA-binding response regulator [Flavobacteriaceae bacterium]
MKYSAIIVDDEKKALESLALKINRLFPEIEITHCIQNPAEAIDIINAEQPDFLFLDVEMPVHTGFDVLAALKKPDFEIIFVTAYSQYAIQAIQYCAIGYVVKPIDNEELSTAISNGLEQIKFKNAKDKNKALLNNLQNTSNKTIVIPDQKGYVFLKSDDIIRLEGVDGYTLIVATNKKPILSSYNIGKFKNMLPEMNFFSVHKSHIINTAHLTKYLNEGYVEMSNTDSVPVAKSRRVEFLKLLRL